jgi:hypothetical protein
LVDALTEDEWVEMSQTLVSRPTMPWFNLNAMTKEDLGAIFQNVTHRTLLHEVEGLVLQKAPTNTLG